MEMSRNKRSLCLCSFALGPRGVSCRGWHVPCSQARHILKTRDERRKPGYSIEFYQVLSIMEARENSMKYDLYNKGAYCLAKQKRLTHVQKKKIACKHKLYGTE